MEAGAPLSTLLANAAAPASRELRSAAEVVARLAAGAAALQELLARPSISIKPGEVLGSCNADGDLQRRLDVEADAIFRRALEKAPIRAYLSEEAQGVEVLDPGGCLAVAIDPLDGSSNIDVNAPVGSIFSIFPVAPEFSGAPETALLRPGREQICAGFFIYGPQTLLLLSFGAGVALLSLDRTLGAFVVVEPRLSVPRNVPEYAINASNYRHWHEPVQHYVNDCLLGADGPRGRDFNMRWVASLVSDAFRIFMRGGVFLYPADKRSGYDQGRLRLLYEANPVAFLAEQADGAATDGLEPILDRAPSALHERTPFVMGSADKVERVRRYHLDGSPPSRDRPLFGRRGLLRV